jgi:hypothetical protein
VVRRRFFPLSFSPPLLLLLKRNKKEQCQLALLYDNHYVSGWRIGKKKTGRKRKREENGGKEREEERKVRGTKFLSSSLDISLIYAWFCTPVQIYFNNATRYTIMKRKGEKKQRNTKKRGREHRIYARFK